MAWGRVCCGLCVLRWGSWVVCIDGWVISCLAVRICKQDSAEIARREECCGRAWRRVIWAVLMVAAYKSNFAQRKQSNDHTFEIKFKTKKAPSDSFVLHHKHYKNKFNGYCKLLEMWQ